MVPKCSKNGKSTIKKWLKLTLFFSNIFDENGLIIFFCIALFSGLRAL